MTKKLEEFQFLLFKLKRDYDLVTKYYNQLKITMHKVLQVGKTIEEEDLKIRNDYEEFLINEQPCTNGKFLWNYNFIDGKEVKTLEFINNEQYEEINKITNL